MTQAIQTYESMTLAMKMEWPELKTRLEDEKVVALMEEYYSAFLAYDAVMEETSVEHRRLTRAYAKLVNYMYGPILMEHD
jgi:hypothetical protein